MRKARPSQSTSLGPTAAILSLMTLRTSPALGIGLVTATTLIVPVREAHHDEKAYKGQNTLHNNLLIGRLWIEKSNNYIDSSSNPENCQIAIPSNTRLFPKRTLNASTGCHRRKRLANTS